MSPPTTHTRLDSVAMAGNDAPPETKRCPRFTRMSKRIYISTIILLLACLPVFILHYFPAFGLKMKVSLLSTLTGGLLASTWTQVAGGSDSNGKFILNLSDFNATSVKAGLFDEPPRVRTTSGVIVGHSAPKRPGVAEFLGIRFGKPPVGDLRFAAPQAYTSRETVSAFHFSVDCPADVTQKSARNGKVPLTGAAAAKFVDTTQMYGATVGEDCLKLNVWTKRGSREGPKAVLFWLYGGGFTKGTTNSFLYDGEFLADTQDVIVVSTNYRVSLFGFPGLPGMEKNVGLLDQRLAVEWTRRNIAAFGGDPNRITLFGQSAGGASIDYYSYAWTKDPIVNGFIAESGVVNSFFSPAPADNTAAWYGITQQLGCGSSVDGVQTTVACMRGKSMNDLLAVSASAPQFGPTADGTLVLADYTKAGNSGRFIKKPILLGNNDYEAGIIKVIFGNMGKTLPLEQWALLNLQTFTCPVESAAQYRAINNVPVWRYRFFGDFPNTRLTQDPSSGAWHGSEISQVFGSSELAGLPNTQAETDISSYIMSAWAAFAKNPTTALSAAPFSWPRYDTKGNTLIRLAYDNATTASFIDPITYDYACPLILKPGGPDMAGLAKISNLTQLGGGSEIGF